MKITFDITPEDVMAFYGYYYDTDPGIRRQLKRANIMIPIFFILLGLLLCLYAKAWYPIVVSGAFIPVWFIFFPRRNRSRWLKRVRGQVESNGSTTMTGERTVEFDEEKMTVDMQDKVHETLAWSVFSKFAETDEYFFLYLAAPQAYAIPKRAMSIVQIEDLSQLLNNKIKK